MKEALSAATVWQPLFELTVSFVRYYFSEQALKSGIDKGAGRHGDEQQQHAGRSFEYAAQPAQQHEKQHVAEIYVIG